MGGIHIRVAYPQRCMGFSSTNICFCRVMDKRSAAPWEQKRHAPIRACGAEDGGGAPGPSTIQGECEPVPKTERKVNFFPCCRTLGRAMHRKARRLALEEAPILFSMSYCVGKTLNSVNVCLECPVFNALGAGVCRPQCLARRWAGQRAKMHVAWPWRRRQSFFSVSYCVGRALRSVSVCLQRLVFIALGPEVCRPQSVAGRWAGRRAKRRVA